MNWNPNNAPLSTSSYDIDCPPSLRLLPPANLQSVLAICNAKQPKRVQSWAEQQAPRCPTLTPTNIKIVQQSVAYSPYASW